MFKFRKAGSDVLNDLDAYLQLIGDEPVRWLEREVKRWGDFTYDELADLIASGDTQLINWQSRYAQVVNERFNPLWLSAIQAASHAATRGRITIDDSDPRVKEFLRTRAAEFVQELSDESKRAVANVILYGQSERMSYRQIAQLVRPLIGLNSRQAQANVNYRQRIYNKLVDAGLSPSTADARAGTSASKYAAKQHRFRAETIVHTELARAYNRGAYDGVKAAIDARLMSHCEMIWSTAGTNRVCSRCLSLKDAVVGHTDEVGVQIPPLHPRCRCVIVYRESSRSTNPKPRVADETTIRAKLEAAKTKSEIRGELIYPPPKLDLTGFAFDAVHTQGDRHPHDVTEAEARYFVDEACFAIIRYNGKSYNYYGEHGAAFVRTDLKTIRTAFKADEYDDKIKRLLEVFNDATR